MEYTKIILKSGKDQSMLRFHPWVFSGAIKKIKGLVSDGDLVEVFDNKDTFLGIGHYQIGSIAVRILSFEQQNIDDKFWQKQIVKAIELRKNLGYFNNKETNTFRLIHAEGDMLPGLIVDYYNGNVVMQLHSVGMYKSIKIITETIITELGDKIVSLYNKSNKTLPFKAKIDIENGYLYGELKNNIVNENGYKFKIDWVNGQKTGFFIDQRENRQLIKKYSKNKDVLNVFGYTGGFSVYALGGGANMVHSVDSSAQAIDITNENINLNFGETKNHEAFAVDAFEFLNDIKNKYDVIVLDPPAFAKHHNVLHKALQGYKKINTRAFEQIKPGGILFTFSCSQVVSKDNFRNIVFTALLHTAL